MKSVIKKVILSILALLLGTGSVVYKNYCEEQIFYSVAYPHPLVARYNGLNVIQLINKAWWGEAREVTLNFTVRTKTKKQIYVRYLDKGNDSNSKGLFTDDLFTTDPNSLPSICLFPATRDLNVRDIQDQGDGSFYVTIVGKLPASSNVSVAILWLNNPEDKTIVPSLVTPGGNPCGSYDSRSFITKYHIVPLILYTFACTILGFLICDFFRREVAVPVTSFSPNEVLLLTAVNELLHKTKSSTTQQDETAKKQAKIPKKKHNAPPDSNDGENVAY